MDIANFKNKFEKEKVFENNSRVFSNPLVSVCVPTYKHVNYIKQCLDSILMQKTNFDFEILLGEDSSTDGTREICIEYAKKYPEKIRLFLHHRQNNIVIDGKPTGRFNFLYNLYSARGKYIALCEGDDYWTDPYKLQKQVDFLENNPDYVLSFHDVKAYDQSAKTFKENYRKLSWEIPETTTIYNLAKVNYIHTPSVVFRADKWEIPEELMHLGVADITLFLLLARYGKLKRFEEKMAVYRVHDGGVWSKNKNQVKTIYKYTKALMNYFQDKDPKVAEILAERLNKHGKNNSLAAKIKRKLAKWF